MGSDSDLPCMQVAGTILEQFGVRYHSSDPPTLSLTDCLVMAHCARPVLHSTHQKGKGNDWRRASGSVCERRPNAPWQFNRGLPPTHAHPPHSRPSLSPSLISISARPPTPPCKVPFEMSVVSAHRTPKRMYEYAESAHTRGLKVVIAGAGGAAHLPGMVAALTPLPVIGVPVQSKALSGNDSLLSIVQMPRGVPVATVAIGNATNAGLLAVRMLAAFDPALQVRGGRGEERGEGEEMGKERRGPRSRESSTHFVKRWYCLVALLLVHTPPSCSMIICERIVLYSGTRLWSTNALHVVLHVVPCRVYKPFFVVNRTSPHMSTVFCTLAHMHTCTHAHTHTCTHAHMHTRTHVSPHDFVTPMPRLPLLRTTSVWRRWCWRRRQRWRRSEGRLTCRR